MTSSKKPSSKTILDLTEAYDETRKKRYKKGKFLGKVTNKLCLIVYKYCGIL